MYRRQHSLLNWRIISQGTKAGRLGCEVTDQPETKTMFGNGNVVGLTSTVAAASTASRNGLSAVTGNIAIILTERRRMKR